MHSDARPAPGGDTRTMTRGRRLEGLDALRGVAALMVAVMHMFHVNRDGHGLERAYLAVDLFFVVSGYVMARTYETRMAAGMGALAFTRLRLNRLWPTMAVGALIGMIAFWGHNQPANSLRVLAMALVFVPSFEPPHPTFPTNPPAWSIVLEILANLLHALLLWRLGTRSLVAMMLVCAGLLGAFAPDMNVGGGIDSLWLGPPRVLYSYGAGILIWRGLRERAPLPGWLGVVALPACVLAFGLLPGFGRWADLAFVFVACPAIVVSGLAPPPFGRRVLGALGAISFPLYAVHFPLAMLLLFNGWGTPVALPVSLACAWVTGRLLDRGWRRGAGVLRA